MSKELDLAKSRLFDRDALAVTNIKLFPGSNRETTVEMFADQINRAISQLESGEFDEIDLFREAA